MDVIKFFDLLIDLYTKQESLNIRYEIKDTKSTKILNKNSI